MLIDVARDCARASYRLELAGVRTVLVGDTVRDVAAGIRDAVRVVALATGTTQADKLATAGATVIVPDLSDTDAVLHALTDRTHGLPARRCEDLLMRFLVLGTTWLLGRAIVDSAPRRRWSVTTFNRAPSTGQLRSRAGVGLAVHAG